MEHGLKLSRGGARHGFRYPPRVFFVRDPGLDAETMWEGDTTLLRIDTSQVSHMRLYADPQYDTGDDVDWKSAYSTEPVPPAAISVVESIEERVMGRLLLLTEAMKTSAKA